MVVLSEQKKILVSLPEVLLSEVDEFVKCERINRSEFIREAMKLYMKEKRRQKIDEQMKKGYVQMGKFNLEYAEQCLEADSEQLLGYEEKLAECE